jgi:hypothetical protein
VQLLKDTFIETGLKELFGIEDDNSKSQHINNISRATNVFLSQINGENLDGTSINLLINEFNLVIREEFGCSFAGNLIVTFFGKFIRDNF